MGWFNVLMTIFIVVSGRKDGVDLVLILSPCSYFRSAVWIRKSSAVVLHQNKVYLCNLNWNVHGNKLWRT